MAIPGIFVKTVLWLQVFIGLCCCLLVYMAWRLGRGLVLVVDVGRVWTNGKWYPISDLSYVTLGLLPWDFADLPMVVLITASGRDLSPGLWRFRGSVAMRRGQQLADQLGIPFMSH
ncbi:MAG: hypothetical protein ACOH16_11215 [Propionibacteriaceae bacterium]